MMIRKVVQQVFAKGYLTVEVEQQLQRLFNAGCSLDDIDALTDLQYAVMSGHVKRETTPTKDRCLAR
jgi:hypothetical protein